MKNTPINTNGHIAAATIPNNMNDSSMHKSNNNNNSQYKTRFSLEDTEEQRIENMKISESRKESKMNHNNATKIAHGINGLNKERDEYSNGNHSNGINGLSFGNKNKQNGDANGQSHTKSMYSRKTIRDKNENFSNNNNDLKRKRNDDNYLEVDVDQDQD